MANAGKREKQGPPGERGPDGKPGQAATVNVGKVTVGSKPDVINRGTDRNAILDFILPEPLRGRDGKPGKDGARGSPGRDGIDGESGQVAEICLAVTLQTNSNDYQTIHSFLLNDNKATRVSCDLVSRKADGSQHSAFKRTGLFWIESGVPGQWPNTHTDQTLKTDDNYDVRFMLSGSSVNIQVRSPDADTAYWRGRACVLEVSTV